MCTFIHLFWSSKPFHRVNFRKKRGKEMDGSGKVSREEKYQVYIVYVAKKIRSTSFLYIILYFLNFSAFVYTK